MVIVDLREILVPLVLLDLLEEPVLVVPRDLQVLLVQHLKQFIMVNIYIGIILLLHGLLVHRILILDEVLESSVKELKQWRLVISLETLNKDKEQ
jgi:hypothetical protein